MNVDTLCKFGKDPIKDKSSKLLKSNTHFFSRADNSDNSRPNCPIFLIYKRNQGLIDVNTLYKFGKDGIKNKGSKLLTRPNMQYFAI